jgi:hypothetical protein
METSWSTERLQLLVDFSSSSHLFPKPYYITEVARTQAIAIGHPGLTLQRGRHAGRVVAIRQRSHPSLLVMNVRFGLRMTLAIPDVAQLGASEIIIHWQLRHPNIAPLLGIQHIHGAHPLMILQYDKCLLAIDYMRTHTRPHHFLRIVSISHHAVRQYTNCSTR